VKCRIYREINARLIKSKKIMNEAIELIMIKLVFYWR